FGPAPPAPVALLDRLEEHLTKDHLGLAAVIDEGDRHEGLVAGVSVKRWRHDQWTRRSGSVHAFHTSWRGASKTRVMTSCGFTDRLAALVLAVMSRPLFLYFAEVLVEAVEALLPVPAVPLHPVGDVLER